MQAARTVPVSSKAARNACCFEVVRVRARADSDGRWRNGDEGALSGALGFIYVGPSYARAQRVWPFFQKRGLYGPRRRLRNLKSGRRGHHIIVTASTTGLCR